MFLDKLEKSALENCALNRELPLLLGVSGGADSLALMMGLQLLGYRLIIAHLDHALRPESQQDAEFVQGLAKADGLPFIGERVDVRSVVENTGQSIEEAARQVRYQFLFKQARIHHAQAVAVAHQADDQVETVLMHFLRGAALSGLSGMPARRIMPVWEENIPLVRPLLGIWRKEIDAFLKELGITPRIDASNQDFTFYRNRIRHELIPMLETYNPQIKQVLWRMTSVLGEEDQFLDNLMNYAWQDCFLNHDKMRVALKYDKFLQQPKALQRRILRAAIALLRPDLRDVSFNVLERGLAFIQGPFKGGELDLVSKVNITILLDDLIVKTWDADLPDWGKPLLPESSFIAKLDIGENVQLTNHWVITSELVNAPGEGQEKAARNLEGYQAWMDFNLLEMPLTVRGRKAGERWQPLGMTGHTQTLQDFFVNEKIPQHLRDIWPLICSRGEVVWVVGLRPSEATKVTPNTHQVLKLILIRE